MKKILTIVIIAALVLASFIIFMQNAKAQGQTSEATVLSYSTYIAPSNPTLTGVQPGDLITVGEVQNVGTNIIANVTVDGIAINSAGQSLTSTNTFAFVYYMAPGQKAPFYLDFNAASSTTGDLSWVPSVSSVTVTVSSVEDTTGRQYAGLTYASPSGIVTNYIDGAGIYTVYGTMVNIGNQAAVQPWVVTTFYNSTGAVIALNYTQFLAASLPPGSPLRFFATPTDNITRISSEIKSYSIQIDSLTMANGSSSTQTSTPTSSSTSSSPTSGFPILPIVVVVVLVVIAIAALMLFRRRKTLPLPPPPPTE